MPRVSESETETTPFALDGPPLEEPDRLTLEQSQYWHALVDSFPPSRFGPDARPTLTELVRMMSYSKQINEALNEMRKCNLAATTPTATKERKVFIQLLRAAQDTAHLIAMLSVKLRLVDQSWSRKDLAGPARERMPTGPVPWEM